MSLSGPSRRAHRRYPGWILGLAALVALTVALAIAYQRARPILEALGDYQRAVSPLKEIRTEFKRRTQAGWEVVQPYGPEPRVTGGGMAHTWLARPPDWSSDLTWSAGSCEPGVFDARFPPSAGWQEFTWELVAIDRTPLDLSLPPTTYPSYAELDWFLLYEFTLYPRTPAAEKIHAELGLPEPSEPEPPVRETISVSVTEPLPLDSEETDIPPTD